MNKLPVEKIEIKQGANSASYLSQVPPPKVTTNSTSAVNVAKSKEHSKLKSHVSHQPFTQAVSQELKQNQSDSANGALIVRGSQLKKDEQQPKEINRVQSMRPIAEPLINKQDGDAKTVYWRMNLSGKDDQTVLLQNKDGINADLSHYEGSTGAVALMVNQTHPSEEQVYQKQIAQVINEQVSQQQLLQ